MPWQNSSGENAPKVNTFVAKTEIIPNQTNLCEKIDNKPWLILVPKVAKYHNNVQYTL